MMKRKTLTRSLFFRIAPTILVTICAIGVMAFTSANTQIRSVYDAQLISSANMLWLVVEDEMNVAGPEGFRKIRKIDLSVSNQLAFNQFADEYADSRMFRVFKSGRLAMVSDGAPGIDMPQQDVGFSDVEHAGERWRMYHYPIPDTNMAVEAGEKIGLRGELVRNIFFELFTPLALLVPVVGLLILYGIGSGLNTLRALIAQIQRRSPDDLSPLTLDAVPLDLAPLGESVNQLLMKLEQSFNAEKRFTEHAAHHLRTPLATIKLQLQLAMQAQNETQRVSSLKDLEASTERASRLVGQLLTSTRISHQPIARIGISLIPFVTGLIEELAPIAAAKQIRLSLDAPDSLNVLADETLLRLSIGNVIENALKYTPAEGAVIVALAKADSMARCTITDSGPGIAEGERALVFERFYRIGSPKVAGTGLGLAIVSESVARLGGTIALSAPESGVGLQVEILLPTV